MFKVLENENEFLSLRSSGIVLLDFYAPWCGPCKFLKHTLESIEPDNIDVKFYKCNVENFTYYNIRSVPTVLIFKDGNLVDTLSGALPAKFYLDVIDKLR